MLYDDSGVGTSNENGFWTFHKAKFGPSLIKSYVSCGFFVEMKSHLRIKVQN